MTKAEREKLVEAIIEVDRLERLVVGISSKVAGVALALDDLRIAARIPTPDDPEGE